MERVPVLLLARELHLGGSERQLSEMVRGLDRDRFATHTGCFRRGGLRAREIEADGIPMAEFPLHSFSSPSDLWSSVVALRQYVRRHGIRVVHSFDAPTNVFVSMAAFFLGRAAVLTSQRSHRIRRALRTRVSLRVSDRIADGIVVNCESVREELISIERVPARRVHLCYNGLDTQRFRRIVPSRTDLVPREALVVGTVCKFRREKDLTTLLTAFARCCVSHPNLFLLIVGDGPERESLQRQARELGISSKCWFEPATSDVVTWLSLIDIFVLPSLFEAFSNALMEAMACECACIASRVGGNPELVRHADTGLLFEPAQVGSLVEQLSRLIEDASLRKGLGRRAAAMIGSKFCLSAAADRLGAIYEGAMMSQEAAR